MFPGLTIYLWYIWWERGHKLELFLNACIMAIFLNGLYVLWTINLLGKQKNPILVEATIAHIHDRILLFSQKVYCPENVQTIQKYCHNASIQKQFELVTPLYPPYIPQINRQTRKHDGSL